MIDFRVRYEGVARREERGRMAIDLLRSIWIGLSGALATATVRLFRTAWSPGLPEVLLAGMGAFVGALLLVRRARRVDLTHELERRHGLGDLLVTALEVDRRGAANGLDIRLLSDAAAALGRLAADRGSLGRTARLEAETSLGVACMLLGVMLVGTVRDPLAAVDRLPALEVGAAGGGGLGSSGPGSGRSASRADTGSGDLAGIAPQLSDHAATREMAEALSRGDVGAAAREARALAGSVAAMSDVGRQQLASTLRAAASALGAADGALGEALVEAGDSLGAGSDEGAAAALSRLAAAFDRRSSAGGAASSAPRPPETRSRSGPAPNGRIALDGTGPGTEALSTHRETVPSVGAGRTASPVTSGGTVSDSGAGLSGVQAPNDLGGPDRLRVPWEWRRTVRRYFARTIGRP